MKTIGRPQGIADAVISVAIPDVIKADLSKPTGSYFGTQLGQNFGGRRPKDDVIDVTASVVFGSAVTGITAGAIPALTSDNVAANPANFLSVFSLSRQTPLEIMTRRSLGLFWGASEPNRLAAVRAAVYFRARRGGQRTVFCPIAGRTNFRSCLS